MPITEVGLASLLSRLDAEIEGCEAILSRIEVTCEALLYPKSGLSAESIDLADIQSIDLLMQTLGDIRTCLQWLSSTQAVAAAEDLNLNQMLRRLKLGDLRNRIADRANPKSDGNITQLF